MTSAAAAGPAVAGGAGPAQGLGAGGVMAGCGVVRRGGAPAARARRWCERGGPVESRHACRVLARARVTCVEAGGCAACWGSRRSRSCPSPQCCRSRSCWRRARWGRETPATGRCWRRGAQAWWPGAGCSRLPVGRAPLDRLLVAGTAAIAVSYAAMTGAPTLAVACAAAALGSWKWCAVGCARQRAAARHGADLPGPRHVADGSRRGGGAGVGFALGGVLAATLSPRAAFAAAAAGAALATIAFALTGRSTVRRPCLSRKTRLHRC